MPGRLQPEATAARRSAQNARSGSHRESSSPSPSGSGLLLLMVALMARGSRGEWYSWCQRTAALHSGPATVSGSYTLDETPAFVRAGSILPMQTNAEPAQNRSTVASLLVWKVFPAPSTGDDAGHGSGRLYEDSGEGLGYQDAQHQEFRASQTAAIGSVSVTVEAVEGGDAKSFAPTSRTQQVELLSPKARTPSSVRCNGQHVPSTGVDGKAGWRLRQDGPWHVLAVRCPEMAYGRKLAAVVEW